MPATAPPAALEVKLVEIDRLYASEDNPRSDLGDLAELVETIKALGILQPIRVLPEKPGGAHLIVSGHRRHAAARLAGLTEVPVLIEALVEEDRQLVQLIENFNREDLTPIDMAKGFQQLVDLGMKQGEIGKSCGISQASVSKHLALLKLPEKAQDLVGSGAVSATHGVRLSQLPEDALAAVVEDLDSAVDGATDPQDVSDRIDSVLRELEAKKKAAAVVEAFKKEGIDAHLGENGVRTVKDLPKGSKPAYEFHWVRDHKKKPCRALVVRPQPYGGQEPRVEEWCSKPSEHPAPKSRGTKAATAPSLKGMSKADREADAATLDDWWEKLEQAQARRREWILQSRPPSTEDGLRSLVGGWLTYDDPQQEVVGALTGSSENDLIVAWVDSPEKAALLGWVNQLFFREEESSYSHLRPAVTAGFVLADQPRGCFMDHLNHLSKLGYEVSWIEAKRAGLPHEEPKLFDGVGDDEPGPAESPETPTVEVYIKGKRWLRRCSECGPVTGHNTTEAMANDWLASGTHITEVHSDAGEAA